jgi:hypothetical protein
MKNISIIILSFFLLLLGERVWAQESGIVFGGSYTKLYEKMSPRNTYLGMGNPSFNYHFGYRYRQSMKNNLSMDATILYGQRRTPLTSIGIMSDNPRFIFNYISIESILNHHLSKRLYIGLGLEPTWYIKTNTVYYTNEIRPVQNEIKPVFDIPLSVRLGYSFNHFEVFASYKYGTCNLVKNEHFDKLKSWDFQLSVYIPIFNRSK